MDLRPNTEGSSQHGGGDDEGYMKTIAASVFPNPVKSNSISPDPNLFHPISAVEATNDKTTFEFRLGDLFRKRSATSILKGWDNNGDGDVSLKELQDALHLIGDDKSIEKFFDSVDFDKSGSIQLGEIKRVVGKLQVRRHSLLQSHSNHIAIA